MKVSASIQGDSVRVSGNKRDDLQTAIGLIKSGIPDLPLVMNTSATETARWDRTPACRASSGHTL